MPKDCKWIEFKTLEEYAEFFEAIPEEKWCIEDYKHENQMCSIGHLTNGQGDNDSPTRHPFRKLLEGGDLASGPTFINDGIWQGAVFMDLGDTPKERILNALTLKIAGLWGVACGIQE